MENKIKKLEEKIKTLEKQVETINRDRANIWKYMHDLDEHCKKE